MDRIERGDTMDKNAFEQPMVMTYERDELAIAEAFTSNASE